MKISLDVHAHLAPVFERKLKSIPGVDWDGTRLCIDGNKLGPSQIYHPHKLFEWMDQNYVGRSLISIPPPMYRQELTATDSRKWCNYLNDGLLEVCKTYEDRLIPLYHLPLEHPPLAVEMARECLNKNAFSCDRPGTVQPQFVGFSAPVGGTPRLDVASPALLPLWQCLDEAEAFVFMHPATCCDGRLSAFYQSNLTGNPHETGLACAQLVFAGIVARFQRIKFCLAHGGGSSAMLAGRWQHGFETARPGVDVSLESPRKSLSRLYVDCITHDHTALSLAIETFGSKHILFGSDWPFPMGLLNPDEQLEGLGDHLKQEILQSNGEYIFTVGGN